MSDAILAPSTQVVATWANGVLARATAGYAALGGISPEGAAALAATDVARMTNNDPRGEGRALLEFHGDGSATVLVAELEDRGTPRYVVFDVDGSDLSDADVIALRSALVEEARTRHRECSFAVSGFNRVAGEVARSGPHHLVATRMWLPLPAPPAVETPLSLTTMTPDEFSAFRDHLIEGYAADMASAGAVDGDAARKESRTQTDSLLSEGSATPGHYLFTARAPDPIGVLWLFVGSGPAGTYGFVYDVEVSQSHRGRGWGRAIMESASRLAAHDGAQYIGLNVFGFNDVARSLYLSMGYRVEGEFFTVPT